MLRNMLLLSALGRQSVFLSPNDDGGDGGDDGGAKREPVPYERFKKQGVALKKANEELVTLRESAKNNGTASEELVRTKAELVQVKSQYAQDMAMVSLATDYPDLADPDVRDFIRQTYNQKGEGRPEFDEFLEEQAKSPSRLLRPYFTKAERAEGGEAGGEAPRSQYEAGKIDPKGKDGQGKGKEGQGGEGGEQRRQVDPPRRPNDPNKQTPRKGNDTPAYTLSDIRSMPLEQYKEHRASIKEAQRSKNIAQE